MGAYESTSLAPYGHVMSRVVQPKLEFTILSEQDEDVVGVRRISRPILNCKLQNLIQQAR